MKCPSWLSNTWLAQPGLHQNHRCCNECTISNGTNTMYIAHQTIQPGRTVHVWQHSLTSEEFPHAASSGIGQVWNPNSIAMDIGVILKATVVADKHLLLNPYRILLWCHTKEQFIRMQTAIPLTTLDDNLTLIIHTHSRIQDYTDQIIHTVHTVDILHYTQTCW